MKNPAFQKWVDGLVKQWRENEHEKRLIEQERVSVERDRFKGTWKAYLVRSLLAGSCLGVVALLGWLGTIDHTTLAVMLTAVVASLFVPSR